MSRSASGRAYNFSAGPSALFDEVLQQAQAELLDFTGLGASVMEISHRGKDFMALAERCEQDLRQLLGIPDDYAVLFMAGGATLQASAVPANLLGHTADGPDASVDYLDSGHWARRAMSVAEHHARVNRVASFESVASGLPARQHWQCDPNAAYLHLTSNETIDGIQLSDADMHSHDSVPLVVDMSSDILSRPLDISRFGVIYAGAQKNIGPSGITLVIVRKDLLDRPIDPRWPAIFRYRDQLDKDSMLNTPPTLAWYLCALSIRHLLDQGGLSVVAKRNADKASCLYRFLASSAFFNNPVPEAWRSVMNVPFDLADNTRLPELLAQAEQAGFIGLKGHKARGGLRASLYNAVSLAAVEALVAFLTEFERRHT